MHESRQNRRRFLKTVVASAALVALPAAAWGAPSGAASPRVSRERFPQSVASGDPRPDRVLLWTRAPGVSALRLQVADDAAFQALRLDREVPVDADSDGCVKVRVQDLAPGRHYHYRFLAEEGAGRWVSSPHGRTRTAPPPEADVPLRFAFVSCQDYGGRWYNSLAPLVDDELDFVLHLGDFIYETLGDPQFQTRSAERDIVFEDADGALPMGRGEAAFLAARSLSNYRQLHRTYRGDPMLQALLERAPLVAIWDDHEFSDDCWQDVATYAGGLTDERDTARRHNAERAYFEYMPVDLEADDGADLPLPVQEDALFPRTRLWRRLRFGRALDLVLTDYRSARPDHLIPEDAFPGAIVYDREALRARLPALGLDYDALAPSLLPYLDLADPAHARLRAIAVAAVRADYRNAGIDDAQAAQRAERALFGPVALPVLAQYLQATAPAEAAALPDAAALPRGLPWLALGKTSLFGGIGARYLVVKDSYDLLAGLRTLDGLPSALGAVQRAWLEDTLRRSTARFKVVASSVSFTSLVLDLRSPDLGAPEPMRHRFYLNVDHWDGFPTERARLVGEVFDPAGGVILLSGDIHSGFATQHSAGTVEFTTPAVSSETLHGILVKMNTGDDPQAQAGRRIAESLEALFAGAFEPLRYVQTRRHGVSVLSIDGERAEATFHELADEVCRTRLYDRPDELQAHLRTHRFVFDRATMHLRPHE